MNTSDFEVGVECYTYNHSFYIVKAMDGFCRQKTKFHYFCAIVDDASSDEEPIIIKKYIEEHFIIDKEKCEETENYVMTYANHKINCYCTFLVFFLKYNHHGKKDKTIYLSKWKENIKYIACCEGDDYWIDSSKLQMQYDLMESNSNISLSFHGNINLYPDGKQIMHSPKLIKKMYSINDIILGGGGFMATNSIFYRYSYLKNEGIPDFWKNCPIGDLPCMLFFASKGEFGYINKYMSVYRCGVPGSWSLRQDSYKKRRNHHLAILKMFKEYDIYTKHLYHHTIIKKKWINRISNWKDLAKTLLASLSCRSVK